MSDAGTPDPDEAVVLECELEAPPETVWRALTQPQLVAEWLPPGEGGGPAGILAADPPRLLRWRWAEAGGPDSIVTFELTPAPAGTRLRLVHDGFAIRALPRAANANTPPVTACAA